MRSRKIKIRVKKDPCIVGKNTLFASSMELGQRDAGNALIAIEEQHFVCTVENIDSWEISGKPEDEDEKQTNTLACLSAQLNVVRVAYRESHINFRLTGQNHTLIYCSWFCQILSSERIVDIRESVRCIQYSVLGLQPWRWGCPRAVARYDVLEGCKKLALNENDFSTSMDSRQ